MRGSKLLAGWIGATALCAGSVANAQQVVAFGSGGDPTLAAGMSGGPVQAQMVNSSCRGYIPTQAQQRVVLPMRVPFFRTWVNSSIDTTLVVRAPNGQIFCADDTWGNNPGVDIMGAVPGTYEIFVGSYSPGVQQQYTVGFSQQRTSTPASMGAQPGMTGPGYVVPPQQPQYPQQQPQYPQQQPQYPQQQYPQQGYVAPPMQGGGRHGLPIASGFLPDPRMMAGVAGGPMDAHSFSPQCRGFVNGAPNHVLRLTTPFNFLRVWARSQADTTLIVRAPTGQIYCADDTYGLNPGVDLTGLPPGRYEVYVGSYAQGQTAPYELGVSELTSSTPTAGVAQPQYPQYPQQQYPQQPAYGQPQYPQQPGYAQPVYPQQQQQPTFAPGTIALSTGFRPDPQMRSGVAGGPVNAMAMQSSCRGFINSTPNHTLYLNTPFNFLRIYAQSSSDTTLVIRGPSGELYCADDTFGNNPGIDLQGASPGNYQIFVGTFTQGSPAQYTLGVTELPQMHP